VKFEKLRGKTITDMYLVNRGHNSSLLLDKRVHILTQTN